MRIARRDAVAAAIGAALVAAFLLPRLNLGVRPRLDVGPERFATHAGAAPIFGEWLIHAGWEPARPSPSRSPLWPGDPFWRNGFRGGR